MTPEDSPKPRRRGRPVFDPPWLKEVAEMVGRGTPLRRALWNVNMYGFTESELKNLYRLKKFREYKETARIQYYREWGRLPGSRYTTPGEKLLAAIEMRARTDAVFKCHPNPSLRPWGSQ